MIDPVSIQNTMSNYAREMEKVSIAEDSWNDVMDMFDGDDIEDESNEIINQVFDELGLELGQSLDQANCPTTTKVSQFDDEVLYLFFDPCY